MVEQGKTKNGAQSLGDPIKIGSKTAPNRLVNQPVECNNSRADGSPSAATLNRYRRLARGGAGMIIIEATSVAGHSKSRRNQLVINSTTAPGFSTLVEAVREINPETLIILQLDHAGAGGDPEFSRPLTYNLAENPLARVLEDEEVRQIGDEFVQAALLAQRAGADGVDFKQCHGYFCSQIIRPANNRQGRYGGDWAARSLFFRETAARMRGAVGSDFILGCRMAFYESSPGGFGTAGIGQVIEDPTEPLALAALIEESGFDFINVSGGSPEAEGIRPTDAHPSGVYRHFSWTAAIKKAANLPVLGSAYSYPGNGENKLPGPPQTKSLKYWAQKNLAEDRVDLIGLGRLSLSDPAWPVKLLSGREAEIDWCTSCNACGTRLGANLEVGCPVYDHDFRRPKPD